MSNKKASSKDTTPKTANKPAKTSQRAKAVNKNLGKSQPLHAFLSFVGWR
jgi:hypothetical protein